MHCFRIGTFQGKNISKPHPENKILKPLRDSDFVESEAYVSGWIDNFIYTR